MGLFLSSQYTRERGLGLALCAPFHREHLREVTGQGIALACIRRPTPRHRSFAQHPSGRLFDIHLGRFRQDAQSFDERGAHCGHVAAVGLDDRR